MRLRLGTLPLARRSGCSRRHLTKSGPRDVLGRRAERRQTAADYSLRRIFVLPLSVVLHTALALLNTTALTTISDAVARVSPVARRDPSEQAGKRSRKMREARIPRRSVPGSWVAGSPNRHSSLACGLR